MSAWRYDTSMVQAHVSLLRTALVAVATILTMHVADTRSVSGHAQLDGSEPISGTPLDTLPVTLELTFTEPIIAADATYSLIDPDGAEFPLASPIVSGNDRSVSLSIDTTSTSQFSPGTWSLRWDVTSATDGHNSSGLVVFSVGTGRAPPEAFLTASIRATWWEVAAEAVLLIGLAAVAAMLIHRGQSGARIRVIHALAVGAVVFVAAALARLEGWEWPPESQSGRIRLAAGSLGFLAALPPAWTRRTDLAFGWSSWTAAIIALSASGHAAGVDRQLLAISITSVHSLIALAWAGAVIAVVMQAWNGNSLAGVRQLARFAPLGLALMIGAGVATAALHLGGNRAVTSSSYGRTLLLKLLIVILVLALAATNRWVVGPWLSRRASADGQSRLILTAEAGILVAVICFAAALSGTSPLPSSTLINVAPRAAMIDTVASTGDLDVQLSGQIAGTSEDQYLVGVRDTAGRVRSDIQRVIVVTTSRADSAASQTSGERFDADPVPGVQGQYSFAAVHLGLTGAWDIQIIIRRSGVADVSTRYEIDTAAWQRATPRFGSESWNWPVIPSGAWALIALACLLPLATIWGVRRRGPVAPLSGAIIMIAVAMIATGFGIQAFQRTTVRTDGHELVSPSGADPIAGQETWGTYCLTCHGATGTGIESPDPLHQHGSRANLVDEGSGRLSDGDLYWLISAGLGNTQMPAYNDALTEQERWDLVAYIHQLQGSGDRD